MKLKAAMVVLFGFGFVCFACAMWQLERKWNYSWSYEAMVKQTVREMVKADSLRPKGESR